MRASAGEITHLSLAGFAFQAEVLIVWVIFSILTFVVLIIPEHDTIVMVKLAAAFVIGMPFIQYGLVILEYTARGHEQVPRMAPNMLDSRAWKLVVLLALASAAYLNTPDEIKTPVKLVGLFLMPAVLTVGMFSKSMLSAFNPLTLFRFIRSMGGLFYSALRLTLISFLLTSLALIEESTPLFQGPPGLLLISVLGIFLSLMMFRIAGIVLHSKRQDLGLTVDHSPEQTHSRRQVKAARRRRRVLDEVESLLENDELQLAERRLMKYLQRDQFESVALYYEEAGEREVEALTRLIAQILVSCLLEWGEFRQAWRLFEDWHTAKGFRLRDSDAYIRLSASATGPVQGALSLVALERHLEIGPEDSKTRQAHLIACDMALEHGYLSQAEQHLNEVFRRQGTVDNTLLVQCRNRLRDNLAGR